MRGLDCRGLRGQSNSPGSTRESWDRGYRSCAAPGVSIDASFVRASAASAKSGCSCSARANDVRARALFAGLQVREPEVIVIDGILGRPIAGAARTRQSPARLVPSSDRSSQACPRLQDVGGARPGPSLPTPGPGPAFRQPRRSTRDCWPPRRHVNRPRAPVRTPVLRRHDRCGSRTACRSWFEHRPLLMESAWRARRTAPPPHRSCPGRHRRDRAVRRLPAATRRLQSRSSTSVPRRPRFRRPARRPHSATGAEHPWARRRPTPQPAAAPRRLSDPRGVPR